MSRIITKLLLLMAFVFSFNVTYAKDKDEPQLQYSIKSCGSGQQGYWVVEVTAYVAKKGDINNTILQKCAVHGALFKGVAPGHGGSPQNHFVHQLPQKFKMQISSTLFFSKISKAMQMLLQGHFLL